MEAGLPFARPMLERARLSRDARFDGRFYLAVVSTGIYCRPICPAAPAAQADHVRYFLTAAAAHEAGFRPCRRCRPETAPGTPAWLGTSAVVRRALRLIEDGALDGSSVPRFAERLGLGARQLDRLFARHLGASPLALAQTRRLHFAKHLLDGSDLRLSEIALAAGYGSLRRFNASMRAAYGCSPSELRRKRAPQLAPSDEVRLALAYRPPYDWKRLCEFLQLRAIPGIETLADGRYKRVIRTGGRYALVQVQPASGCDALELCVRGAPPTALLQIVGAARRVFDLTADPGRISSDLSADRRLQALVRHRPGLRIPGAWDPFECAVRAVLGQQVSVAAAKTLATRLVERFGEPVSPPVAGLTRLFPTPAALADGNFGRLGITGPRSEALRGLARAVLCGRVDFAAEPEAVTRQIGDLRGFGAWTAQYVALRALGEPDALPEGDRVLRREAGGEQRPLTPRELQQRADSWRPWRGYATLHLWCAASERASSMRAR